MTTDLDTFLIALCVEPDCGIIPSPRPRSGPGHPMAVTDAELVCLAVAQLLLRFNDERHWLRAAPAKVGYLFPRLLPQSAYNQRLREAGDLMEVALRGLAARTPSSADAVRIWDGTPVRCGASREAAKRSDLAG
ncbi:hypothetical protein ACFQ7F_17085 [Streptomyces sp. NPDC056486]|uniref:hypothetical protein n=1 Tax=Streptomyces sp. NPDC056486 TaxID=3345835 RepID=UPI0036BF7C9B